MHQFQIFNPVCASRGPAIPLLFLDSCFNLRVSIIFHGLQHPRALCVLYLHAHFTDHSLNTPRGKSSPCSVRTRRRLTDLRPTPPPRTLPPDSTVLSRTRSACSLARRSPTQGLMISDYSSRLPLTPEHGEPTSSQAFANRTMPSTAPPCATVSSSTTRSLSFQGAGSPTWDASPCCSSA